MQFELPISFSSTTAGQECKQEHPVDGGSPIKEFAEPPLKKFVTAPRLKEDLAKCAT